MLKKSKNALVKDGEETVKIDKPVTPLPKLQIFCVCLIQMAEAMNVELLFPFLAFMVEDMGYTGEQLGYHAGILAASFCGAQFCTSVAWGMISDTYGRKFAIVTGTLGAGIGMLIFGFSKSFYLAILGRVVGGLLNGNLGVAKSFITEITDESNRSAAFYLFSLSWAVGSVCAPLVGGLLCKPAEKYPSLFSSTQGSIWVEYPYLFPCLLTVSLNVLSSAFCMLWMVETVGVKEDDPDVRVTSTWSELHNSTDQGYRAERSTAAYDSIEEGIQLSYLDSGGGDEPSTGASTGLNTNSTIRNRSMSMERHTAMAIATRAGSSKVDTSGGYSRLPLENAVEEYTTDYERVNDTHSSQTSSSNNAASLPYAMEAVPEHSPLDQPYTSVTNSAPEGLPVDNLEYKRYEHTDYEGEGDKPTYSAGQYSNTASSNTIGGRVRNRSRSRSTSDAAGYMHLPTTDYEHNLRVPSGVTQAVPTPTPVPEGTSPITTYYPANNHTMHRSDEVGELSEMEEGDLFDTDESDEPEEICCPTLLDHLTLLGRYMRCANKSRAFDTAAESSTHNWIGSESAKSLQSVDGTVDTTDTAITAANTNNTKLSAGAVLTQRIVVLAALNYAMVCASSILIEETLPLFMKLEASKGGFGFGSTQIGALLSTGAAGMMVLTMVCMPLTNGVSNKFMSKMSIAVNFPLCMSFPFIALLNNQVLVHMDSTTHLWLLWPLLILINTLKNLFSCFMFTSSVIMVNHSVTDEYLGAANGLGQSLGALARSLGPAVGGLLWSVATRYNFVYLNFIAVAVIFALNYYVSYLVPDSLDYRKKEKRSA